MRLIQCEQGSQEWLQARAGCITASMFKVARERVGGLTELQQGYVNAIRLGMTSDEAAVLAGYKGKPKVTETMERAIQGLPIGDHSEAAKNYAFRLAIERKGGVLLDEGFQTWQMKRGHELEPDARMHHEEMAGVLVERAGFVQTDDGWFGASADGFIGEKGGCEYKCLVSPEGLREVLLGNDISQFIDQIQGCMWITGREWWHFGLYCPALAAINKQFFWREVRRDDEYIEKLESELIEFNNLVLTYQSELEAVEPDFLALPMAANSDLIQQAA